MKKYLLGLLILSIALLSSVFECSQAFAAMNAEGHAFDIGAVPAGNFSLQPVSNIDITNGISMIPSSLDGAHQMIEESILNTDIVLPDITAKSNPIGKETSIGDQNQKDLANPLQTTRDYRGVVIPVQNSTKNIASSFKKADHLIVSQLKKWTAPNAMTQSGLLHNFDNSGDKGSSLSPELNNKESLSIAANPQAADIALLTQMAKIVAQIENQASVRQFKSDAMMHTVRRIYSADDRFGVSQLEFSIQPPNESGSKTIVVRVLVHEGGILEAYSEKKGEPRTPISMTEAVRFVNSEAMNWLGSWVQNLPIWAPRPLIGLDNNSNKIKVGDKVVFDASGVRYTVIVKKLYADGTALVRHNWTENLADQILPVSILIQLVPRFGDWKVGDKAAFDASGIRYTVTVKALYADGIALVRHGWTENLADQDIPVSMLIKQSPNKLRAYYHGAINNLSSLFKR